MEKRNISSERKGDFTLINYLIKTGLQLLKNIAIYLSVIILILLFSYIMLNRYTIVAAGDRAYKINKLTGKTWFIAGTEEFEVKPYERKSIK